MVRENSWIGIKVDRFPWRKKIQKQQWQETEENRGAVLVPLFHLQFFITLADPLHLLDGACCDRLRSWE